MSEELSTEAAVSLKERVEGLSADTGGYEITMRPPENSDVDEPAVIRLKEGDLKDGHSFNLRLQHLEAFHVPARGGYESLYEFTGWVRDNVTAAGEGVER